MPKTDKLPREDVRKALRDYDNPKSGKNPNYNNSAYLEQISLKFNMSLEDMRKYVTERAWKNYSKR